MKETTCYVALNFEEEMALVSRSNEIIKEFTLPDDQVIQLSEYISITEPNFIAADG